MNMSNKEVRLLVLGKTGVGKSCVCNTVARGQIFQTGTGASSVTLVPKGERLVRGSRTLLIADTPDVSATSHFESHVKSCMEITAPGPHVFIHVVLRLGLGRYTREDEETVLQYKRLFGRDFVKYLIIVFTGEDDLASEGMSFDEYLSECPASLQRLVAECNYRYLTVDNRASDEDKDRFTEKLLSMVDGMIQVNGHYTMEMFEAAERKIRMAEEEERKRVIEEKKKTRDDVEKNIREAFKKRETDIDNFQRVILHFERLNLNYNTISAFNQKLSMELRRRAGLYESQHPVQMNTEIPPSENITVQKLVSKLKDYAFGVDIRELAKITNEVTDRSEDEDGDQSDREGGDASGSDETGSTKDSP